MAIYLGEPEAPTGTMLFRNLLSSFMKNKENHISKGSLKRYMIYVNNFLEFMDNNFPSILSIKELNKEYVVEYLNHRLRIGKRIKTVNGELGFIKSFFNYAVNEDYILKSSIHSLKPFRDSSRSKKVKFWTKEEINLILNTVSSWCKGPLEFLYHTGLRKEELINLTWADVSIDDNNSRVEIQSKDDWTTKTNRRRIVPLNPSAVEIIKSIQRSDKHEYIFCGKEGNKLHHDRIYNSLKITLKRLGFTGDIHKFRHTFATHLVSAGEGIEVVSLLLGHSSIEMTMKYAHVPPERLQTAVNSLVSN